MPPRETERTRWLAIIRPLSWIDVRAGVGQVVTQPKITGDAAQAMADGWEPVTAWSVPSGASYLLLRRPMRADEEDT